MGSVRGVSGTSILSNGDISLILDIQSLIDHHLNHDPAHENVVAGTLEE